MPNTIRLFCLYASLCFAGCGVRDGGEVNWVVMGTVASVKWNDNRDFSLKQAPKGVRAAFARIESLLNAHDPKSELSRLAGLPDAQVLERCSPEVRSCYETAFRLRDQTGGMFNPRWRGPGTMDLGAIAKGFAIDCALKSYGGDAGCGRWRMLVDLGGNLKASGTYGWTVGIKDGGMFELAPGQACATSAEYFRGKHIYDARTGKTVTNGVYSVTVVHPSSAMLADGLSTALFIMGRERGEAFLKRCYPEARAHWVETPVENRSGR